MKHFSNALFQKTLKMMLALLLAFSVAETSAFTRVYALEKESISTQVSDPDTTDSWQYYFGTDTSKLQNNVISTGNAGYVWGDKSVFTKDSLGDNDELKNVTLNEGNFLVELSSLGANKEIVGYSTIPTDTMFVLDLSNSMSEDSVLAMVEAVNKAIDELLTLNNYNRVGVAVYATNSDLLLPLDCYTTTRINNAGTADDTSDDYKEYIFVNDNNIVTAKETETVTITFSNVSWTKLAQDVNSRSTIRRKGTALENYLADYFPSSVSIDWQDMATKAIAMYGNQPTATQWEQFIKQNYGTVTVSTNVSCLTGGNGNLVNESVAIGGGTYIQSGLWEAWQQFNAVTDTTISSGIQAGTKRMPVMVLMSDGAPTYATTSFNNVGTKNRGTGGSASATSLNAFASQLTAAYIRGKMEEKYERSALFYSLGLNVGDNEIAKSVLDPGNSTTRISDYWDTYLAASSGSKVRLVDQEDSDDGDLTVDRDQIVTMKSYVDKYFGASNSTGLINAFEKIVDQIILQSKYYPTLVESAEHDLDGYITFTDKLGKYMEVKNIKGLLTGNGTERKLYQGSEFSNAITSDVFGNISSGDLNNLNDKGILLLENIKNRLNCSEADARTVLQNSITNKQISSTDNYIGWYADKDGNYLGYWNGVKTNSPLENAVYYQKSYIFYGKVGSAEKYNETDMMYIIIGVSEEIATGQQTVVWKIPASLVPLITYHVAFDGTSYDDATNIRMTIEENKPICVDYEVGLRSDINEYNMTEKVDTDYVHKNDDGTYTFYSNMYTHDANGDAVDPGEPRPQNSDTTWLNFKPSLENERYYYINDSLLLDENHKTVTSIDSSKTYYREVVIFKMVDGSPVMDRYYAEISANNLSKAVKNDDGYYYIPKGTPFGYLSLTQDGKSVNTTDTLEHFSYPTLTAPSASEDYHVDAYLGNNGKMIVKPAQGIKLSKEIDVIVNNTNTDFEFEVQLTSEDNSAINGPFKTLHVDKDGVETVGTVNAVNGKFTVNLAVNETIYITDIPANTTYTITEKRHDDYSVKSVKVNGELQSITSNSHASGKITAYELENVEFVNTLIQEAALTVTKEVKYPFTITDDQKKNEKSFTITVALGSKYSNETISLVGGNTVTADENGNVTLQLKDGETVVLQLEDGDYYQVTETNLPAGFSMDENNSENLAGTIHKEQMTTAKVVNTYQPGKVNPVNVELKGDKTLIGRKWLDTDSFEFQLEYFNGTNWVVVETHASDKNTATRQDYSYDLSKTLQNIDFTEVGTYRYRVTEINRNQTINGVTYDNYEHVFDIVVTDDDLNGKLEIKSITAISEEKTVVTYDDALDLYTITADFTNTYTAKGNATFVIDITKLIQNDTGTVLGLSNYKFELYDNRGKLVATSNATDDEGITKIELVFNQDSLGTMTYTLKEAIPNPGKEGMYYDDTIYNLTVTIVDNLDGTISGTIQVDNVPNNSNSVSVAFTNVYDFETVSFHGTKALTGRDWLPADSFSFDLYQTAEDFDTTSGTKLGTETVTGTDGSKEFTFDEITYYNPGTYYYVIKEVNGGNRINGVTYDAKEYRATVTITRDADKKLSKTVVITDAAGNVVNDVAFINVYTADPVTLAPISGTKTLTGRDMNAGEFTFSLYEADKDYQITNQNAVRTAQNAAGSDGATTSFAFGSITYTTAGDYYYVVKEESGSLGGITYDSTVYRVKVSVVDNLDGTMSATVSFAVGQETKESISFTNRYSVASTTLTTLGGNKTLTGREWLETDVFTFDLYETDADYVVKANQEAIRTTSANKQHPEFTFDAIEYQSKGTHYYVVKEQSGSIGGITYDQKVFNIQVDVTDNLDGTLTASIVSVNGSSTGKVEFTNKYNAKEVSLGFAGNKVLDGRAWKESDSFTIELYETDADYEVGNKEALQTKSVRKDATGFVFDKIKYTEEGTYYYVIKEQSGSVGGITYDTTEYRIQVTVEDNQKGELVASTTIIANGEEKETIVFTNIYRASSVTTAALNGTKTLNGRDMNDNEFTFNLYQTDATYNVANDAEAIRSVQSVSSKDGIASAFTFGTFTFDREGTYYYVAKEEVLENPKNGINYDTTVYQIRIDVTDDTNGNLVANATVVGKDNLSLDFVNSYAVTPSSFDLEGTKTLTGRTLKDGEFSFDLYKTDYTFTTRTLVQTVTNNTTGKFVFSGLKEMPGTYYYIIEEKAGDLGGVTYDSTYYHLTVTIEDNGIGGTKVKNVNIIKYEVTDTGTIGSGSNVVSFVNTYQAKDTDGIVIGGTKSLTGREIVDAEFTFDLYETASDYVIADGAQPIQTVNDGNSFAFEAIKYDSTGDHYYVVKEHNKQAGGMEYDTAAYQIHVKVTDDGKGELDATIVEM
ncbi:MAG: FctA domain-containing protein, partial [Erysipelotrichaceae bacterium]|nr:FctA domain-containing protein [Erysipelotrichaceae bacterium]